MKKLILLALPITLFFTSCKKENIAESTNQPAFLTASEKATVRYEFRSSIPATYKFITESNNFTTVEQVNTGDYRKTVTVSGPEATLNFIVYAPEEWENTDRSATYTMTIFVNDREYATRSGVIRWADRHAGERLTAYIK